MNLAQMQDKRSTYKDIFLHTSNEHLETKINGNNTIKLISYKVKYWAVNLTNMYRINILEMTKHGLKEIKDQHRWRDTIFMDRKTHYS